MAQKRIGIIGGSGLYSIDGIEVIKQVKEITPFGDPSDELVIGGLNGREVVFLPRHGRGHRILPSDINYQANIWIMKKLGVEWIVSVSAVGSFKEEIQPLDMVLVDQFIDLTRIDLWLIKMDFDIYLDQIDLGPLSDQILFKIDFDVFYLIHLFIAKTQFFLILIHHVYFFIKLVFQSAFLPML